LSIDGPLYQRIEAAFTLLATASEPNLVGAVLDDDAI